MNVQKVLPAADSKLVLICSDAVYVQEGDKYEKIWAVPDVEKNHLAPLGAVNTEGTQVAVCDAVKKVYRINLSDGICLAEHRVDKAPTCVVFGSTDDLYVADRSGDICLAGSTVVAGHVSMVTDICLNETVLISCDRDEKIRLTSLEPPYPIEGFLLGHTAYVSAAISLGDRILSVSGDGTARLWKAKVEGSERKDNLLYTFDFDKEQYGRLATIQKVVFQQPPTEEEDEEVQIEESETLIVEPLSLIKTGDNTAAVIFDKSNKICHLAIDQDTIKCTSTVSLPEDHWILSACHSGDCLTILAWNKDHACLYQSKRDAQPEMVCEYPTGVVPDVWKGVWRKDCHGMFARRLKSKRARQDDVEESDDE